jgi:hypothetical protein
MKVDRPVSLCHVKADLIRGMGPVFACSGINRLSHQYNDHKDLV